MGLILVLLLAAQIWFAYITMQHPYLGINLSKNADEWTVSSLDKSTDGLVKLEVGDQILKIDGVNPDDYFSAKYWRTIEQADSIKIMRNGTPLIVDVGDVQNSFSVGTLPLLAEAVSLLMAVLLYFKLGRTPSARFLALVFFIIGLAFMSLGASARGDALGKYLIINAVLLTPIVFLHFLLVLLSEKGNISLNVRYMKYLYGLSFAHMVLFLGLFLPAFAYYINKYNTIISLPYFVFGIVINFFVLIYLYRKHRRNILYLSTIIKTIWVSLVISFSPVIILSFLPQIIFGQEWIGSIYTAWFILFLPLSFTYLIATERLYDIPNVVRRILFTALMAVIPSGIIVAASVFLFTPQADMERLAIQFILIEALITFILYSLEYITTKLNKFMFPHKYYLQQALGKIARDLATISSLREIKEIVLVDIMKTLQVYGVAIVFKFTEELETISIGEIDLCKVERHIADGRLNCDECTIFPINRHEEYSSFLVVTKKKANTMLVLEEHEWLNLIITYLSVSLENIYLIRKLTTKLHEFAAQALDEQTASEFLWFRKSLFELLERERQRIANDLHDTTMQDLLYLKRKLAALMNKMQITQEERAQLNSLIEYIEAINSNLRQSCFELFPHLLRATGLVDTIEKTLDIENVSVPFQIYFRPVNVKEIERLDMEQKRHLFRIVQELINNAKKHSNATEVAIELAAKDGMVTLSYRDDGIGFDYIPEPVLGKSGVGMLQLKSRVLDLNGQLDIKSNKGGGLKVRVAFPLNATRSA